jgi:hypothetical protein
MHIFTIFDTITGRPKYTITQSFLIEGFNGAGHDEIAVEGVYEDKDWFYNINTGSVEPRPTISWSKTSILADGNDFAEINLPANSQVTVFGSTTTITSADILRVTSDEAGYFLCSIEIPFPGIIPDTNLIFEDIV